MSDMMDSGARGGGEGAHGPRRYFGKYAAIVVDNAKPDDGDHRGQLKVRVPGILEETPDGSDSQAMEVIAAPSFLPGYFFIPENEAQVWVEFVAGDINYPIWTGVWYPNGAVPTTSDGDSPTEAQKVIRTPTGQVIHLDDTDGSEKLVVKDEKNGNTLTFDKDGVKVECALTSGTSTITMDSNGVTITFGQSTIAVKNSSIELTQGPMAAAKIESAGITMTSVAGSAQPVVLAPLIDWLLSHQHVGNMGAPTPLFPADLISLQLQKSLTMTTKA